ncbi:RNA polymerase subunit sigma-70 [Sporosarcina sp. P21c]|uniref:sigma-70 family RNA polymerase sigma factor n=1 Tax=unclassified Sporosarcina TaxID=2647733 RepID=UPI000C1677C6|nr:MULTISPECIES: sigma-70 family RNA polymerase sigma factor [unclassified Sporosarcina]PIC65930.1 RNA polymerase subunit sigma-70 [Sporosarcina sp. P16a]PIC88531.1 RNA polymerase subunit sigma-70 [Sporosarcina sp. P21c]PIC91997.1 RNA polymerase subunit sigma-70 [Sporosarcina sp. P25]
MESRQNENFEHVMEQYEPMISAVIRKLNIYRDFDNFRQTGRIALFHAWTRFDETKGNFTPFAYRSIYGAMLDDLKKESRFSEVNTSVESETLEHLTQNNFTEDPNNELHEIITALQTNERELLINLYVENKTQAECATHFGISVSGIKKRREKLLMKLKDQLTTKRNLEI